MPIELFNHQKSAIKKLSSGSILKGGVGTGKSLTAIAYYYTKECKGELEVNGEGHYGLMKKPKDLYIITTAKKRDSKEWEKECMHFLISNKKELNPNKASLVVDSWNNIKKYKDVENAFFIFDEQRVVGYGTWVKSFIAISKKNNWILLSATPGDTWADYIPVFIANGFYKNKTEFMKRHAVYSRYSKYPKVERWVDTGILLKYRQKITVVMEYEHDTRKHHLVCQVPHNKDKFNRVFIDRWNIYENKPIKDVAELYRVMRRLVNSDFGRIDFVKRIWKEQRKVIVFYNFNYELEMLRNLGKDLGVETSEWNGHKHEPVPDTDEWLYLVQYTAGAEGWNCVKTDTTLFYSLNYSYKIMRQAAGRTDRLNTPYDDLYYYTLKSDSWIDKQIDKALKNKRNFTEKEIPKPRVAQ